MDGHVPIEMGDPYEVSSSPVSDYIIDTGYWYTPGSKTKRKVSARDNGVTITSILSEEFIFNIPQGSYELLFHEFL
ncbi:hypothetical protein EDD57_14412 [Baia soyae]|uniref:Uncharacterized protein n=1 Tax=Baia soyae TaxID=1544746 RepID=A0A4R2RM22_9BACL|nr:hypothetical protein EDD57_14412 [Baia soyae]